MAHFSHCAHSPLKKWSISEAEEWLDFLQACAVKYLITEENGKKTLLEFAHKNPAYIADY